MDKVEDGGPAPMTVYMPRGFDDERWRGAPDEWLPDLMERGTIADDGTAEFHVADILGTEDAVVELDGHDIPVAPPETNFVVCTLDGDPCDQGDTVHEVVSSMRASMSDWDWPMEVTFVFWHHHQHAQRLPVLLARKAGDQS